MALSIDSSMTAMVSPSHKFSIRFSTAISKTQKKGLIYYKLILASLVCRRHRDAIFLYQHDHNKAFLSLHFSPKILSNSSMKAPEPPSLSFWTVPSCSHYSRCLCSLARIKLQAQTSCIGHLYTPACWEKLNNSLPCLAEVLADHTCLGCSLLAGLCFPFSVFCFLPSLCSPWCTES